MTGFFRTIGLPEGYIPYPEQILKYYFQANKAKKRLMVWEEAMSLISLIVCQDVKMT